MTRRKKGDTKPLAAPIEEEMAQAAPAETPLPEASADEVASASLFTEEADSETGRDDRAVDSGAVPAEVEAELTELRARAEEYLDGWQRARAEFANYKKRIERDQEGGRGRATAAVLTRLLPVIDDLLLALRDRPAGDEARPWADGIDLICRKLQGVLEAEGVEPIPTQGEVFDPLLHEAVTHEDSPDHREGEIIDVIQPGYRLGERVLRPARVRVAR